MKIYKTKQGILIEDQGKFFLIDAEWDSFINDDSLLEKLTKVTASLQPIPNGSDLLKAEELLPPIGRQEIWASGVTYMRSRSARIDESKDAGGGDFYDRVYNAERPELFFKSMPHNAVGSYESVRIRKDSKWNVPEPELTLLISTSGKIIGYTIGNDMSSRDIEGENPLYLPQAKTYNKSAGIGPGILVRNEPLPGDTTIQMDILRQGNNVYSGEVTLDQIKRKFTVLAEYLCREYHFPNGGFLMTGTGIVPPNEFTLNHGDEIRITIAPIGTLVNIVE